MSEPRKTAKMRVTQRKQETKVSRDDVHYTGPVIILENYTLHGQEGSYLITKAYSTSGGESDLYLCEQDGTNYIAKLYRVGAIDTDKRQKLLDFLKTVSKDGHVMPVVDYGSIGGRVFDILPYYPQGDLSRSGNISYQQLIDVIIPSINAGLHEIHENGFIHRDIKPTNLYMHEGKLIIGDFGIASVACKHSDVYTMGGGGTLGYRAPEIGNYAVDFKSDYFSFGVTIASLYKGSELFKGHNEIAIGNMLARKNLPVDIPIEHKRLQDLINGLITFDIEFRFGYEEVHKWCQGIDVVPHREMVYIRPYKFNGQEFTEPVAFSESLAENWEQAVEHLYRGHIYEYFRREDQHLSLEANKIVEQDCIHDQDLGLFRFLYLLNKGLLLWWKGRRYQDLAEIANLINSVDQIDQDIVQLLKSGALSWRLSQNKKLSEAQQATLEEIRNIDELAGKGYETIAYYLFMFRFLPQEHSAVLQCGRDEAASIDEVFQMVAASPWDLFLFVDDRFYGFLCYLGYQKAALLLHDSMTDNILDNVGNLLNFFDKFVEDKAAVRLFYIQYGPYAHLYWLQQNLHLYSFNGQAAAAVGNNIAGEEISEQMELDQINTCFRRLEELGHELLRLMQNNIFLAAAGINQGTEEDGITTHTAKGFFLYDFYGRNAPLGFADYLLEKAPKQEKTAAQDQVFSATPSERTFYCYSCGIKLPLGYALGEPCSDCAGASEGVSACLDSVDVDK